MYSTKLYSTPSLFFQPSLEGTAIISSGDNPISQEAKLINHTDNITSPEIEINSAHPEKVINNNNKLEIQTANLPQVINPLLEDKEKNWYPWKDLYIHEELFTYGIVAIKSNKLEKVINCNNFSLKEREFTLHINSQKKSSEVKKSHQFLEILVNAKKNITINKNFWIANKKRRDEIFSPLTLNDEIGFYICPWTSTTDSNFTKNTTDAFKGFKQFVTAGCLFGSSLKGFDQLNGATLPLIKHDIKFYPGQIINEINLGKYAPYEDVLFHDLEKIACLIDSFSMEGEQKQLLYHLPYHDYILYGLELYIRGRMTYKALAELIEYIHEKKAIHISKINEVCERHQIKVTIESPFENLFCNIADCLTILETLNIPTTNDDIDAESISEAHRQENEKKLVKTCLTLLGNNSYNITHAQVWKDFIKKAGEENVNTLEDLFKIANAVMVGVAASDTEKYTTCSLLPISEKQIQCSYAKCVDHATYPSIVNFTFLDPLLTYGQGNNGLVFYCAGYETTLSELINETGILNYAQQNMLNRIGIQGTKVNEVKTVVEKKEKRSLEPDIVIDGNSPLGVLLLQFASSFLGNDNKNFEFPRKKFIISNMGNTEPLTSYLGNSRFTINAMPKLSAVGELQEQKISDQLVQTKLEVKTNKNSCVLGM